MIVLFFVFKFKVVVQCSGWNVLELLVGVQDSVLGVSHQIRVLPAWELPITNARDAFLL